MEIQISIFKTWYFIKRIMCWQGNSVGAGACHHAWWPKVSGTDKRAGDKAAPASCPLMT